MKISIFSKRIKWGELIICNDSSLYIIWYFFFSRSTDSARDSVIESESEFLQDNNRIVHAKGKSEKSSSPANGSISSVEDESGFSSMNSFQEVGLPLVQPTPTDEVML